MNYLQSPLASIIGYADILLNGVPGSISEQQSCFVMSIRRQSESLKNVVNYVESSPQEERAKKIRSLICPWQVDDFIPIVSHDLRTPLTVIIGYTGMMLHGLGGRVSTNQRDVLQLIKWHADEMNNLILDLLDQIKAKTKGGR